MACNHGTAVCTLRLLSKQKSAGVSTVPNAMLQRVFVDGKADTVALVLLPFARICTSGCVGHTATMTWTSSTGAGLPTAWCGDTLVRLISTSLMTDHGTSSYVHVY